MKRIVAILLAMLVAIPAAYLLYTHPSVPAPSGKVIEFPHSNAETGSEFVIKKCRVIDGWIFYLAFENGQVMEAMLPVATKDEATAVVAELLSNVSSPPTATLLRKTNDKWVVDIQLTIDGQRVRLRDVLKDKDLLL
jgi:hypothetical protein